MIDTVLNFISEHPYITGGILAAIGLLSYFKIKLVMKAVGAVLILSAIAYVLMFVFSLTSTGIENKEKFISDPGQAIERFQK